MTTKYTFAALTAAGAVALVGAAGVAPAAAAPARTLLNGHVSVAAVDGALPVGAGVSVIQHCPKGSDLDRAETRAVGGVHDDRLKVASREYWPAGTVTRYRVVKKLDGQEPAMVLTAALCRTRVASTATTLQATAKTDLRVWGPAPANVELLNAAVVVVTDDLDVDYVFRTSMRAAGVNEHPAGIRGAVEAVQESVEDGDVSAVVAAGRTNRRVARGTFISMVNNYRFTAQLDRKISVS